MFTWFEKKVNPYPLETPLQPPKNFWAFLWTCTREIRLFLALMTLTTACCGAFEALLYAMLGGIVDWLGQTPPDRFWAEEGGKLILLAVIILGSPLLIGLMSLLKFQTLSANFPMRLRWIFHRYLLSQSMKFYQDEFAGRIATKVMQTALAVRESIFAVADILVYIVIYFLTMAIIVAHFDPWLLVPYFVWLAAYASTLYYFVPQLGKVAAQQADARALMSGRITDAYANIMTVKLFSHTDRESDYARSAMSEFMVTAYGQMRLLTAYVSINYFLSMAMIVGAAGCSLWLWTDSRVGIGAVAATSALAIRLNGISQWLMWEMAMLFENIGTVQDGINTLSKPIAVVDPPNATELKVHTSEIVFDDVTFSYGNRQPVIKDFSLHIRPGEKIGLVGRSGAGKSTLVNLLLRFYNLEQGRILIDGQDIAGVTQNSLRSQIGMVTQDTSLLHRSVRDNLLYGLPNASEETMIEAAINAEAHEFINGLTDPKGRKGYDAHVGERGVKLSGGQRQRIAIARVMLKDAPILLLDEATSALDSEVEAAIQASLYKLMHGKTVVAIAHRLSTIAAMDRLVVIDKGRIVEEGDHASLLASGGIYARLWEHQSGGFLGDDEEETAQQTMEPQPSAL